MVAINQLSKCADLQLGNQIPVSGTSAAPNKLSLYLLSNYLAQGVFSYLSIEDYVSVPGVPFASLPDPVEVGAGARATCTDADRIVDTIITVGKTTGTQYGYSTDATFGDYGELSNTVFSPNGGTIILLWWQDGSPDNLLFALDGDYPNSGWNTIIINGTTFARADAGYAYDAPFFPGLSVWEWTTVANPFGAEGDVEDIYFGTTGIEFNDPVGGGGSTHVPVFSDGELWRAGG